VIRLDEMTGEKVAGIAFLLVGCLSCVVRQHLYILDVIGAWWFLRIYDLYQAKRGIVKIRHRENQTKTSFGAILAIWSACYVEFS
jgi:hypothetical protein